MSQRRIDSVLADHSRDQFAKAWLDASGLSWAAAVIDDFDQLLLKEGEKE